MALIACPDCGQQVSDAAPACPRCGRPRLGIAGTTAPVVVAPTIWNSRNAGCLGCGALILLVAFAAYFGTCVR
jgi:hypothetical protein